MLDFNKLFKEEKKKVGERQKKSVEVMDAILAVLQEKKCSLAEMADVFLNLQINLNKMMLDEIDKLKKDE